MKKTKKLQYNKTAISSALLLIIVLFVAFLLISNSWRMRPVEDYEDCAKARYSSILDTKPQQCMTIDGEIFINQSDSTDFLTSNIDKLISSFEECVEAGYNVLESFPQRCITSSGKSFENKTQTTRIQNKDITTFDDCVANGFPIKKANPRECLLPNGKTYIEKPPIVDFFACKDNCPGVKEEYMVKIYEGITDPDECALYGGTHKSLSSSSGIEYCIVNESNK